MATPVARAMARDAPFLLLFTKLAPKPAAAMIARRPTAEVTITGRRLAMMARTSNDTAVTISSRPNTVCRTKQGFVERRRNPADRRSHALYLTDQGREKLREAQQASAAHEREIGASLTDAQRTELAALLRQVADDQGISEDSLPGPPG